MEASPVGKNDQPRVSISSVDPAGSTLYRGLMNVSGGRNAENSNLIAPGVAERGDDDGRPWEVRLLKDCSGAQ